MTVGRAIAGAKQEGTSARGTRNHPVRVRWRQCQLPSAAVLYTPGFRALHPPFPARSCRCACVQALLEPSTFPASGMDGRALANAAWALYTLVSELSMDGTLAPLTHLVILCQERGVQLARLLAVCAHMDPKLDLRTPPPAHGCNNAIPEGYPKACLKWSRLRLGRLSWSRFGHHHAGPLSCACTLAAPSPSRFPPLRPSQPPRQSSPFRAVSSSRRAPLHP